ncbi:MAG TPA: arginine--tRNA ligase, partial [Polyangiaceae bacterium]|nr:arginine--tRNA ligase [Polyangiaceae bacterium]
RTIGATRILYVVGAPQQQHLAMVFATAKDAGWLAEGVRAEHVAFGSVLGADKKMFKTRSGDSVKLIELLDEAADRAMVIIGEKNPDLDETTRRDVARKIGIGAIKYADLASDRMKDYVFDWDRMLAFEGNTAPYLQYAHARIRSIFRRAIASSEGRPAATEIRVREPAERALVLDLLAFQSAAFGVAETLHPHKLCTYVYNLASRFTAFYEHCPVLKAEDTPTRESRLSLCDLTANVLAKGLDLLGIEAPNQM